MASNQNEEAPRSDEATWVRQLVAKNLSKAIEDSGLSKAKVFEKARISKGMLYNVLSCKQAPTTDLLAKLAGVLDIHVKDFFNED